MDPLPIIVNGKNPPLSPLLGGEEKGEGGNWGAAQRSII